MRVSALRGPAARLAPYRLPLLLAVFLVCFLLLLQELPTNPELRLHSARWLGLVLVGDSAQGSPPPVPGPPPGTTLPLPRRHSTTAGSDPKALVVVMMGECSSCTRFRTAALNDIARTEPGVEVVGAAEVQPGEAARLRKEQGLLFDVVPDPTSRLHRLYWLRSRPVCTF